MKRIVSILIKKRHSIIENLFKVTALIIIICFARSSALAQLKEDSMSQHTGTANSTRSTTIHQEVDFKASPQRVYEALLDQKQFSEFSTMSAQIDPAVGGTFSLFNNHIIGRNLELVPNQRIVQAWRVVDWAPGVYSIARFELIPQGSGTHLIFEHTGFPENLHDHLAEGWQTHYWDLLTKYLQ